ncbi:hypothetical protein VSK92_10240 [Bacillus swezeyi]|uniref:hypothetical protein n=1 Tax=Bacillus swezeyi TaxID=1925020 RepID=UPI0039C6BB93
MAEERGNPIHFAKKPSDPDVLNNVNNVLLLCLVVNIKNDRFDSAISLENV